MNRATRLTVSTMGVITALAALEHGLGETLQGNVAPPGLVIESWPDTPFFDVWAGEPAMTLIPNLLLSGLLTMLVALLFLVWVTRFIARKHGALVLLLLSLALLLIGGGFGPPLLGLILSAASTRINASLTGSQPGGLWRSLGQWWRGSYVACIVAWLLLFPGAGILTQSFGVDDPNLMPKLFFTAFGLLLLTLLTAFAHDSCRVDSPLSASR
jgi:hypothetical protein